MADISKIKTPDGTEYNIKDTTARANSGVTGVKGSAESSYRTGNVNITAANVGAFDSASTIPVENGGTPYYHWYTRAGGISSKFIKISINTTVASWMLDFTLRIYSNYNAFDVQISGYNYGSNYWYSPCAKMITSSQDTDLTVYFGYTSVNKLWIAFPANNYVAVDIIDILNAYAQLGSLYNIFAIELVDAIPETVQTSKLAQHPLHSGLLSTSTSSTSTTTAATSSAVKTAYDLANTANTTADTALSGVNGSLIYDHTYTISNGVATFTPHVYLKGEEVTTNYAVSCFKWKYRLDSQVTGTPSYVNLTTNADRGCTITISTLGYGGHVIGEFTPA